MKVESERIELSSKQVTKGLSTRLVFSWFSIGSWLKTLYSQLNFFRFRNKPKLFVPYVNFYDASCQTAVNQGFLETFSFPALQDVANLTIVQIKQLKRSYSRRLMFDLAFNVSHGRYTTCLPFN